MDGNTSAFPRPYSEMSSGEYFLPQQGMTLLDYFAARIMPSLILHERFNGDFEGIAKTSYDAAEAMLIERSERERMSR